jgi:hypothetical protein
MGWSSPIVWGEKIFLTSVVRAGKVEAPKKGLYFGGNQTVPPKGEHRWMVYCLDWRSGKVVWEREADKGEPDSTIHGKNTLASETPVTDGERLYAYFGNRGLFCYDLDGRPLWSRKWPANATVWGWAWRLRPSSTTDGSTSLTTT